MEIPAILGMLSAAGVGVWKIVTLSHKAGKTEQRIVTLEDRLERIEDKLDELIYDLRTRNI